MPDKRILVIEDDIDVRRGLGIRLAANHYGVGFAGDASSGLAEVERQRPDLIILDLGLPGEDGYVVLSKLAASGEFAATPVIVLSARDRRANEQRVKEAGAQVFCQKPVDNEELLGRIRELLSPGDRPSRE
ncbi:MAG TPA: response regulator [Terriglobales bacterium]|nr:response regulator [Terriglobales bacterium]